MVVVHCKIVVDVSKLSGHCDVRIENGRAIFSFEVGEGTFPSVVFFIDFTQLQNDALCGFNVSSSRLISSFQKLFSF